MAADGELDELLERIQEWAERTLGDVGWTMLEFEFIAACRHDPDVQAALASALGMAHGMVLALVNSLTAATGTALPLPARGGGAQHPQPRRGPRYPARHRPHHLGADRHR